MEEKSRGGGVEDEIILNLDKVVFVSIVQLIWTLQGICRGRVWTMYSRLFTLG